MSSISRRDKEDASKSAHDAVWLKRTEWLLPKTIEAPLVCGFAIKASQLSHERVVVMIEESTLAEHVDVEAGKAVIMMHARGQHRAAVYGKLGNRKPKGLAMRARMKHGIASAYEPALLFVVRDRCVKVYDIAKVGVPLLAAARGCRVLVVAALARAPCEPIGVEQHKVDSARVRLRHSDHCVLDEWNVECAPPAVPAEYHRALWDAQLRAHATRLCSGPIECMPSAAALRFVASCKKGRRGRGRWR